MIHRHWLRVLIGMALLFAPAPLVAAPHVTLELMMEEGVDPTTAQEWIQALSRAGADDLRIRAANPGDVGDVVNLGTDQAPSYRVTGFIGGNDRLRLPGVNRDFTRRDTAGVAAYLAALRQGGVEELTSPKGAFGLTAKELVTVHDKLSAPVTFKTHGARAGDVLRQLVAAVQLKVTVDDSARAALGGQDVVTDELYGVSSGTAIAAALRPLGLVLTPLKPRGGDVQLLIVDARKAAESWPVGWPPKESPGKAMPKLYTFISVEIDDIPLGEALAAIQERLESPILLDQNSLARQGIDAGEVRVKLPSEKLYYKKIIDRLLTQAKLKSEVRVDEAGEPFLWVSTIKR